MKNKVRFFVRVIEP